MINVVLRINSLKGEPCFILHIDSSVICKGMLNWEWEVLPPGSNNDAMPLDATFSTISPRALIVADKTFHTYVLPVPPYPFKKKIFEAL